MARSSRWGPAALTDRESSGTKGRQAEELACAHLRRQGLATSGKNWTCRRGRARSGHARRRYSSIRRSPLPPASRLGRSPGEHRRAQAAAPDSLPAELFPQQEARWAKRPCRFDVVTVDTSDGQSPPRLDWIQNAFDALISRPTEGHYRWTCNTISASSSRPASRPSSRRWKYCLPISSKPAW